MKILTKAQIQENLQAYYQVNYGESDRDEWFPAPAANVWMFQRDSKVITLRCHILTGFVTEQSTELPAGELL